MNTHLDINSFEVEGLGTFTILGIVLISSVYLPKLKVRVT
jgi:hypothetical protein